LGRLLGAKYASESFVTLFAFALDGIVQQREFFVEQLRLVCFGSQFLCLTAGRFDYLTERLSRALSETETESECLFFSQLRKYSCK